MTIVEQSVAVLLSYVERNNYKGWDPYDGLNSVVFKRLPVFRNVGLARLAWIQLFKRSPVNFRKLLLVPKGHNPKGLALFLSGYCNLVEFQIITQKEIFGSTEEIIKKVIILADLLISVRSNKNSKNSCWGYNFDWQSKAFFLPSGTPTIVVTSFAVQALMHAYEITRKEEYLSIALSSGNFIKDELNRIPKENGLMFSYSPLDNQAVYNATLLATKTLSQIYSYSSQEEDKSLAFLSARAVCDLQNDDGSFPHSDQVGNRWRDNFHTAFKLESLAIYKKLCSDNSFDSNLEWGFNYWHKHFFDHDSGIAYYYDTPNRLIDLHCAAQAIPTFYHLSKFVKHKEFITRMLDWAINNMQDEEGFFYYQKRGDRIIRIPYMRWPNAWMFYGMSYYLKSDYINEKTA